MTVLRISKLALTAVCRARIALVAEAVSLQGETCLNQVQHNQVVLLQKAIQSIPNPSTEGITRSMANKLGNALHHQVKIAVTRTVGDRVLLLFEKFKSI